MRAKGIVQNDGKGKRGRPKVARPMKRVNISVYPEEYEDVERMAGDNGMSAAMLVRLAIREFLDRRRDGRLLALKLGPRKGNEA